MAQQEEEELSLGKMDSRDPLTKEINLVERDPKQINQDVVKVRASRQWVVGGGETFSHQLSKAFPNGLGTKATFC